MSAKTGLTIDEVVIKKQKRMDAWKMKYMVDFQLKTIPDEHDQQAANLNQSQIKIQKDFLELEHAAHDAQISKVPFQETLSKKYQEVVIPLKQKENEQKWML